MNILSVDTSGPSCSVALMRDGGLCYESRAVNRLTHSKNLMPMVEEALLRSDLKVTDIDLAACVVGPGSFTGVRIGVAMVQGLCRALQIKAVAVDALQMMADSVLAPGFCVSPIRDARANQVYGAIFKDSLRLSPNIAEKLPLFLDRIRALGQSCLFLGDGVPALKTQIEEGLGDKAWFAPPHLLLPGAGAAALYAFQNPDEAVPGAQLKPLYLRAPQAERLRNENHG